MGQLDGKVAVITGGASGIGAATTRLFVAEGARVVIADLLEEKGKLLAEELGNAAVYVRADVSDEVDVRAAIDLALGHFGGLDSIFNNAGSAGVDGPISETSIEGFDRAFAVLVRGVFLGMKLAAPIMQGQGSGSIINTGSVAGLRTGYGPHAYSAAKAAVIHLTRTVAMELGESGVRVNCICPGGIATPIFGKQLGMSVADADQTLETLNVGLASIQPIQRAGQPEDIAQAALWLASPQSSFVTGHTLVVDGGLMGGRLWSQSQKTVSMLRQALGVRDGAGAAPLTRDETGD